MNLTTKYVIEQQDFPAFSYAANMFPKSHYQLLWGQDFKKRFARSYLISLACVCLAAGLAYASATYLSIAMDVKLNTHVFVAFGAGFLSGCILILIAIRQTSRRLQKRLFKQLVGTNASFIITEEGWRLERVRSYEEVYWRQTPSKSWEWNGYLIIVTPRFNGFVPQRALDRPVSEIVKFMQEKHDSAVGNNA